MLSMLNLFYTGGIFMKKTLILFLLLCSLAIPLSVGAAEIQVNDTEFVSAAQPEFKFFLDKDIEVNLSEQQKNDIKAKEAEIQSIVESALTDEQKTKLAARKADREAQRANLEEKWQGLSEAQKEDLYALHDNTIDSHITTIAKYADMGLLDAAAAQAIKDELTALKASMRENGKPMFGAGRFKIMQGSP
jgi:hypothetical protein